MKSALIVYICLLVCLVGFVACAKNGAEPKEVLLEEGWVNRDYEELDPGPIVEVQDDEEELEEQPVEENRK